MEREQINYNKVVNFDKATNTITVLDNVFEYPDGFRGATGSIFEPITKEDYEETITLENIINYLHEYQFEVPSSFSGIYELAEEIVGSKEAQDLIYDTSYSELWDYIREELNFSKDEAYIFNCVGGGRCFNSDFQGNVNPELSAVIREYESK